MLSTLAISDAVWVAIITAASGLLAIVCRAGLAGLGKIVQYLATISESSSDTKVEVAELKHTISCGLDSQARAIGRVVDSVNKLTDAVDEHSNILKQHDERLRQVEGGQ